MQIENIRSIMAGKDELDTEGNIVHGYYIKGRSSSDMHIATKIDCEERVLKSYKSNYSPFTLVYLANNTYAYQNACGTLLPYRFDYATTFNEYGLAMVCLNGKVTWMNDNFEMLTYGEKLKDEDNFDGFDKVHNFSAGNNPLSLVDHIVSGMGENESMKIYFYVTPELKFKKFYKFDGQLAKIYENCFTYANNFSNDFTKAGTLFDEHLLLSSEGYYVNSEYVIKYVMEHGISSPIFHSIDRLLRERKK